MLIRLVIFVVLMMFWLFAGYVSTTPDTGRWAVIGSSLVPWICVAILGYEIYKGTPRA